VNFSLLGNAVNGTDYTQVSNFTAVIPSGTTTAAVSFQPLADAYYEGSETVLLEITPAATTYNIQTGTAAITITEPPPGWIGKISGDGQVGAPGDYLAEPMVVEVKSGSSGTLLINAPVLFSVASGSGGLATTFGGTITSGTLTAYTGTNGRAQAWYQQGSEVAVTSTITAQSGTSATISFTSETAAGLWSHWPFNEGTGTTVEEATGLGGDGTLTNGPAWSQGFDGRGAVNFTGGNGYVTMGTPTGRTLDLGIGGFSLAFWVKYSAVPGSGEMRRIVGKGADGWGAGYFVGLKGDGKLAAGVGATTATQAGALLFKTTSAFNDGQWHHVVVNVDKANAKAQIFVDGTARSLEKEASTGGTVTGGEISLAGLGNLSASSAAAPFTVASFSGTAAFFAGEVDEVQVHRTVLTAQEISDACNIDIDNSGAGDGLPDRWEWEFLGTLAESGTNDGDGDGLTNLQEYEQGSDPREYYNGALPVLQKQSGDGQSGVSGEVLASPLVVKVMTSGSVPLAGAPVAFSISGSYGQIATSGTGAFAGTQNILTGTNGTAAVYLKPSGSGGILNEVQALVTSGTASTSVTFSGTTELAATGSLSIVSGNNQIGRANEYLASPLTVEVRSGTAGTLQINAPVTYTVTSGSGGLATQFGGTTFSGTLPLVTGSNGRAQAYFRQAADLASTISVTSDTSVVTFTSTLAGNGAWSSWSFDDGYGLTALETTGLGADGTLTNNPLWSEGFDGMGGVEFSGSNAYVTMGDPTDRSLNLGTDSFTIAFWVRYTEVPGSSETFRIVSKGFDNFGSGYFVGLHGDGKLAAGLGTTSGTSANAVLFKTTGTFNDAEWHAVAAVYDRANEIAQIYVDGTAQNIEKEAGTGGTVNSGTLSLAGLTTLSGSAATAAFTVSSFSGTNEFFQGEVDQVEVHKSALGGAAISAIYNTDSDGNELPDWWEYKHFQYVGVDPDDDDDRDGLTNADEYEQGSDPRDYYSQGETTITPVVSLISGNGQTSGPDEFLTDPFTIEVLTGTGGTPLFNAPVVFTVTSGSGVVASQLDGAAATPRTVFTGTNGHATAWYRQGSVVNITSTIIAQAGASNTLAFEAATLGINSLVGHWKFDEGTGTSAADSAPFVHTGTLVNGPQWQERFDGEQSLVFSGSGAHVATLSGTDGMLDFADANFSVTAWIKSGTAPVASRIVSKGNENSNAGYYVALNGQGQIETGLGTTQSGTIAETIHVKTTGSFNDNAWHAVAAVYDRRNSTAKIYVDGTVRTITKETGSGGTINVSGSTSLDYPDLENLSGSRTDTALTVASQSGTTAFFQGGLDEVRVYRKALSAGEVLDLYREEGELVAVAGQLTVLEDALGEITLESCGGGEAEPVYSIVTSSTNGALLLSGSTANYRSNLDFSGTDGFRFRVTKGANSAEANVAITVTPVNDPPFVSVGGGRSITMSGTTASLVLGATVTDVDTAQASIHLTWMKVSGTGAVTFTGTNPLAATAVFDAAGEYVLQLLANDGSSTRSDSLIVSVNGSSTGTLPTVSLVDPEDEASYENGQTLTLKAAASAGSGLTVAMVEFFEGSRKLGQVTSPAATGFYELAWTPAIGGAYRISAKVTDSTGAKVFSDSIVVSIAPPSPDPYNPNNPPLPYNPPNNPPGNQGPSKNDPEGDSDGDGLTNAEEDELGTDPGSKHSDTDGVPDGVDGWALDPDIKVPRLPDTRYAVIPLNQQVGYNEAFYPSEINDSLDVLTYSSSSFWNAKTQASIPVPLWYDVSYYIYIYNNMVPLAIPISHRGRMNNTGVICGVNINSGKAATWSQDGGLHELPEYNPYLGADSHTSSSTPFCINDSGIVGGKAYASANYDEEPSYVAHDAGITWNAGNITTFGLIGDDIRIPDVYPGILIVYGINENGVIIGAEANASGGINGAIIHDGVDYSFPDSVINSINSSATPAAVGHGHYALQSGSIYLKLNGAWVKKPLRLTAPQGGSQGMVDGSAAKINDRYELLGIFSTYSFARNGHCVNLDEQVTGWSIGPTDINNKGAILASATKTGDSSGSHPAFLLPFEVLVDDALGRVNK